MIMIMFMFALYLCISVRLIFVRYGVNNIERDFEKFGLVKFVMIYTLCLLLTPIVFYTAVIIRFILSCIE